MAEALDKLLEAAADLTVAEMREIKKGIENRIPARVSASYDTVCALNEWGLARRAQPQAALPLGSTVELRAANYIKPRAAYEGGRADKYSPPSIDDVKHLVGLALPAIVRIHQLRRLLGMGVEPFSDMTAIGEPDGTGRARRAIREWVYRAAPFTSPQLQDMLDTIAECLGEQKKD